MRYGCSLTETVVTNASGIAAANDCLRTGAHTGDGARRRLLSSSDGHGGALALWRRSSTPTAPAPACALPRKGASAPTDADDRFDDSRHPRRTPASNAKEASVIWAGVGGGPPGVADVCFLRMRSSACRCRLDCGGSRFRPTAGVGRADAGVSLCSTRRRRARERIGDQT